MNALVYKRDVEGPATHAIVICVGHYLHLPGGESKNKFPNPDRLTQLKSPPPSARAIARWLIEEYDHPKKPLASLALLCSDKSNVEFTFSANGKEKRVEIPPATIQEVKPAIRAWHDLGNQNPDHLLLFFFCGHGLALGHDLALLLSDFGADPRGALDGALNFRLFRQGMDECAAREQCYFVDACRVGSELLIQNLGNAGDPVIHRMGTLNTTGRLRQAPVFYSTLSGGQAYAKPGKPSLFTQALLEAFAGAGSGDEYEAWRVQTNHLHHVLDFLMADASRRLRIPQLQLAPAEDLTTIHLNYIASPMVPVLVSCKPEEANSTATLSCENDTFKKRRKPAKDSWLLRLPVATYDFCAKIETKDFKKETVVRPTYKVVNLEVKS
ncbi:MAG: caspase family protein [Pyrinomonadaceae bacterium]